MRNGLHEPINKLVVGYEPTNKPIGGVTIIPLKLLSVMVKDASVSHIGSASAPESERFIEKDAWMRYQVFERLTDCPLGSIEIPHCNVFPKCKRGCCHSCKDNRTCKRRCIRVFLKWYK